LSHWRILLDRTVSGLERFRARGQPVPEWVLGGGTALMLHSGHRLSKDVDAFIDDPQYISLLSPRLGGEEIWACETFDETANYLKLVYSEGEVDFIVAGPITDIAAESKTIDLSEIRAEASCVVDVEHPVETALKKLSYRGTLLKIRDVFDIAVVDSLYSDVLHDKLRHVAHLKSGILERLRGIQEEFFLREIEELAILDRWRPLADNSLHRLREIAAKIPDAS
jgi:hypothetical protein